MKKRLNLKAETLCDYKVSSKMKKIWQAEMDIYEEFERVCKKHNLKYIFCDGSLLGAIRHKGFIPWDDDIDVMMTREEYNKLVKIADKEFKEPFFFQTTLNDDVFRGHAQVRDSRTTAIMYTEFSKNANQGIFIDIFVADKVPENKILRRIHRRRVRICKPLLRYPRVYECKENPNMKDRTIKFILDIFFGIVGYDRFFKHYEKLCAKYNKTDSKICNTIEWAYNFREIRYEHLIDIKNYPFEYLSVPGPVKAEEFLTDFFGDWKEYVIGTGEHGETFFDPDNSYKKYQKMSLKEIRKLDK